MSAVDDFEELLGELLDAGIFEPAEDGELRPTGAFRGAREECREEVAALEDDEFHATLERYATAEGVAASDVGVDVLGDAVAIYRAADALDRERGLLAALALERIEAAGRTSGIPDGFVQLDGEDVDGFVAANPAAVVYFWREDCGPCDGARESFEALLDDGEIPESVGLGAVYGPDSADLIREEYQVGVAPTTLFCVDGSVDSRIVGAPGYDAIRNEVATIVESLERGNDGSSPAR